MGNNCVGLRRRRDEMTRSVLNSFLCLTRRSEGTTGRQTINHRKIVPVDEEGCDTSPAVAAERKVPLPATMTREHHVRWKRIRRVTSRRRSPEEM
ncbi:hypothetical protein SAY86_014958 [Trapa natans]|uniref:Uncharacterized protein n=1 Tax=Trapa natans TaxID=22666 RepID=A0AAN7QH87_TRANT|nr:hypothetical protein SAY86_014958 [Trapa natans]